eukprot:scaffold266_cov248-Pinguiococcus_pyrenoidosus.AAC.1
MDKAIYIACQEFGVRLTTGEARTSAALEDMGLGRGPSVGTASVEVRPAVSREALESKAQTLEVRGGKTRSKRQAKKRSEIPHFGFFPGGAIRPGSQGIGRVRDEAAQE